MNLMDRRCGMRAMGSDSDREALLKLASVPATILGATLAACGATMRLASIEAGLAIGATGIAVTVLGAILRTVAGPDARSAWEPRTPMDSAAVVLTIMAALCVIPLAALG